MLKIKVKYFLNDHGLKYFMKWYEEVSITTSQQDGFIKISCENNNKNPIVCLYFENEHKLSSWATTEIHDHLVSKLERHYLKAEEVVIEESILISRTVKDNDRIFSRKIIEIFLYSKLTTRLMLLHRFKMANIRFNFYR